MTIEEQLTTLLATTQEHTKQLEMDGLFIRQLAQLAAESREDFSRLSKETREDIKRMTNAMEALIELNAHHETRLNRLEGNE